MSYTTFTVDQFCSDSYFINWVVSPNTESNRFWRAFMVEYPHKIADIQQAVAVVRAIQFYEIDPSEAELARLKQRIWNDIDPPTRVIVWYRRPVWVAAAVFLLVALAGGGWWASQATGGVRYRTDYGKTQLIQLPDGSQVTLNANSSLRVADDLANLAVREVWLNGEAYFSIAKRQGATFIVHTPEATVEVLGTEFNVNTRRDQTNVVLHRGKVQLTATNRLPVVMKPGEMAVVVLENKPIQLRNVRPEQYDTWKESYLVLDGKSLPDIISILEDTFGVTITLDSNGLADKKLSGKLRIDNASDCVSNLAIILEAEVKKTGDTYLFE